MTGNASHTKTFDMSLSKNPRAFLTSLFEVAVAAAQPDKVISRFLPAPPKGRTIVIGAGKGSAQMARAFEQVWDAPYEGLVVTRFGFACPTQKIEIIEASHPVPDASGQVAAQRLLELVDDLTADDLVIALISGGGSALLPCPLGEMVLDDEIALNKALLMSGAPISAMNAIRKQLSGVKGGRLAAAAYPARVVSLVVSDVPGDDPAMVASGPTIPDETTRADARRLVDLYNIPLTDATRAVLLSDDEQPKCPRDEAFARNEVHIIASAARSLEAAASVAEDAGYNVAILSDAIEGESKEIAKMHGAMAIETVRKDRPVKTPALILSGGETTVTMSGTGRGGRNSEFLLSFALSIEGVEDIYALAADTDGIDGSEDNAGAFADGTSAARMREDGLDPNEALDLHDSYGAFQAIGDLYEPGPTGTNVNDFRAILIK